MQFPHGSPNMDVNTHKLELTVCTLTSFPPFRFKSNLLEYRGQNNKNSVDVQILTPCTVYDSHWILILLPFIQIQIAILYPVCCLNSNSRTELGCKTSFWMVHSLAQYLCDLKMTSIPDKLLHSDQRSDLIPTLTTQTLFHTLQHLLPRIARASIRRAKPTLLRWGSVLFWKI